MVALVLDQLQRLAALEYEAQQATSGFLFVSEAKLFLQSGGFSPYDYLPFENPLRLVDGFFDRPASHRYVDGANSFYLVDRLGRVHGIARCSTPDIYTREARASFVHLKPLLSSPASVQRWIGYVRRNGDVCVVLPSGRYLRWFRTRWQFVDPEIAIQLLRHHRVEPGVAHELVSLARVLSENRLGTLILIREESPDSSPPVVGKIDDSSLGAALRTLIEGRRLEELIRNRSAIGILSSDGLTSISQDGQVLRYGDIIATAGVEQSPTEGGGRTRAAAVASRYGLVLKVSQDGPMSFFQDGAEVLRIRG